MRVRYFVSKYVFIISPATLIGSYQFLEGLGYSSQNLALGENSLPSITLGIDYNRTLNLVEKGSGGANQDDKPQWLTGVPIIPYMLYADCYRTLELNSRAQVDI